MQKFIGLNYVETIYYYLIWFWFKEMAFSYF